MTTGADALGLGGPGAVVASGDQTWINTVEARGQSGALASLPSDFGPWGGSIAFDNSSSTNWYFGLGTSGLASNQDDFFSVAEHEIGHVLGIGTSQSWLGQSNSLEWNGSYYQNYFDGPKAEAVYGGPVPLSGQTHWDNGTTSNWQLAIMDPNATFGDRRYFTPLDFAGLADIGWEMNNPSTIQFSQSNFILPDGSGNSLVTVTRTGGYAPVTVRYATSDATAKAGIDYSATSGKLAFAFGQTTATIAIPILDNSPPDGDRTFNITLSNSSGSTIVDGVSTVTIHAIPTVTATTLTASATSVTSGQPITFTAAVVARPPDATTPTGSVTFNDGSTTIGTAPLDANGVAMLTTTLSAGQHSIIAVYSGAGSRFSSSTSTVGSTSLVTTGRNAKKRSCGTALRLFPR